MANLTITVDDETLRQARIRALQQGTSVNAVLAAYLARFAGQQQAQERALDSLLALAAENDTPADRQRARRRGKRSWSRDDLHER
jgi:plasmid stability protein